MTVKVSNFTTFGGQLADLNNCTPGRVEDAQRALALFTGVTGLGSLLNALIAQGNAGSAAVAAHQDVTAVTPAAAAVLTLTLTPTGLFAAGVQVPAVTISRTLSAGDAVSATTCALAMKTQWNATPAAAALAVASNIAGVLTLTPVVKGVLGNSYTIAATVTNAGGTTWTVTAAALAGGTGANDIPLIV